MLLRPSLFVASVGVVDVMHVMSDDNGDITFNIFGNAGLSTDVCCCTVQHPIVCSITMHSAPVFGLSASSLSWQTPTPFTLGNAIFRELQL